MLFSFAICRKRLSSSNVSPLLGSSLSKSSEARLLYDGGSIPRRPNAGLLLEDIKQEAEDYSNFEGFDGSRMFSSATRRASFDGGSASDTAYSSGRQALKQVKMEDDMYAQHEGETSFSMFASLLDSAIQG
jgi:nuclear pore complex protein Nup107